MALSPAVVSGMVSALASVGVVCTSVAVSPTVQDKVLKYAKKKSDARSRTQTKLQSKQQPRTKESTAKPRLEVVPDCNPTLDFWSGVASLEAPVVPSLLNTPKSSLGGSHSAFWNGRGGWEGSGGFGPVRPLPDDTLIDPVPEPLTWVYLVSGFGLVGFSLRRSKQKSVVA